VEQDTELLAFYKQLIAIRKANPALVYGDIDFLLIEDKNEVLVYNRRFESKEIIVIFNKSNKKQQVKVPVLKEGIYQNALHPGQVVKSANGLLTVEIESVKAIILMN
jgi:glycosidase